jgi:hypothetical protein
MSERIYKDLPKPIITKAIAAGGMEEIENIERRMADALNAVFADLVALPVTDRPGPAPDEVYRDYFTAQAKGMMEK